MALRRAFLLAAAILALIGASGSRLPADPSSAEPPVASPPSTVQAPPPAAPVNAPAAVAGPVASVPLHYVQDKPAIDVMIDGQGPFQIGIDSGSETLVITQKVADGAKLATVSGTVAVAGTTGGYVPIPQAEVDTVQIGAAIVAKPFCTVTTAAIPVDGYLGAPLFNFFTVQIDPGAGVVNLYKPDDFKPAAKDLTVPITLGFHRTPVVKGAIGGVPASLQIDTGSAFPAELLPGFVTANNLRSKFQSAGSIANPSVNGPVASDIYVANGVSIGENDAAGFSGPIPTLFRSAGTASPADGGYDGRIGAPLLRNFVLTFDYAHSKMYIHAVPPPQSTAAPSPATAPASSTPAGSSR